MFCYGINSEKVTLKRQKSVFSMEKGFESDALQAKSASLSMLNGEKQGFSMEKGIESDARQAKNARFSMLKGEKQGFSMEKASNQMLGRRKTQDFPCQMVKNRGLA